MQSAIAAFAYMSAKKTKNSLVKSRSSILYVFCLKEKKDLQKQNAFTLERSTKKLN